MARELGIEVRAGLHTGECELRGDDLAGLAVHVAARIGSLARPGEVLVSTTVKDLVAGSDIEFVDRGEHKLEGVPATLGDCTPSQIPPWALLPTGRYCRSARVEIGPSALLSQATA